MIIEFIGTPGAGKTTLLPIVIEHFKGQGFPAFSYVEAARPFARRTLLGKLVNRIAPPSLQRPLLWQLFYHTSKLYRLPFFVKHSKLVNYVLRSQKQRPISAEDRRHVMVWFFNLVGCYEFLKTRALREEVLIFDEGFIHRVVQMNVSDVEEPDPTRIYAYIDLLPRPDLVIFLKAPWEVCEERIYSRGLWERFRSKTSEEVSRYVANAQLVVNLAVDYIVSKGWFVIQVDNEGDDLEEFKEQFRQKIIKTTAVSIGHPSLHKENITVWKEKSSSLIEPRHRFDTD